MALGNALIAPKAPEVSFAAKFSDSNFINYKTDNLSEFLRKINEQ